MTLAERLRKAREKAENSTNSTNVVPPKPRYWRYDLETRDRLLAYSFSEFMCHAEVRREAGLDVFIPWYCAARVEEVRNMLRRGIVQIAELWGEHNDATCEKHIAWSDLAREHDWLMKFAPGQTETVLQLLTAPGETVGLQVYRADGKTRTLYGSIPNGHVYVAVRLLTEALSDVWSVASTLSNKKPVLKVLSLSPAALKLPL